MSKNEILTTADVAKELGVHQWQVRRLFSDGNLPEPPKVRGYRVIQRKEIGKIRKALVARGFLKETASG